MDENVVANFHLAMARSLDFIQCCKELKNTMKEIWDIPQIVQGQVTSYQNILEKETLHFSNE